MIKSQAALLKEIKKIRASFKGKKSKKIVFTNGCFDILHAGHVMYLEKAKKKGDILIVALNVDASISKIKGPERPINCLKDRMMVMDGLRSIDYVTWFEEETPINIIKKILPDVLVKGGDWSKKTIVGWDVVEEHGGKVFSIPLLEGRSTTRVVNIIKKKS